MWVMRMLSIKNLNVEIQNKLVLKNFNIDIEDGSIHVIMGPNGVGKSTLSRVIMGDSNYIVKKGSITFNNEDITKLSTDVRSRLGIFLAMQNPLEVDGVSNQDFLRTAISSHKGKQVGLYEFIKNCEAAAEELKMDKNLIHRSLNVGFSGGEKKRNEILQLLMLQPKLAMLDETDSGLDVDAVQIVSEGVAKFHNDDNACLIITHNARILDKLKVDKVHVLMNGRIAEEGGPELVDEINKHGFSNISAAQEKN